MKKKYEDLFWYYLFLLPMLAMVGAFVLWPIIGSVYYSFFQWDGFSAWPEYWIGLRNYSDLIQDKYFWNSLGNTFFYVFFQNLLKLPITLFLAWILVSPRLKGSNVYRTLFFLPVISNTAIIGIVMKFILSPWNGPINLVLLNLGLIQAPLDILGNTQTALWAIVTVETWHMGGQYIVYWMAGLQSIPKELYEAAEIDGASGFKSFISITIPVLKPIIIVVTLLGIVNAFKVFDMVMVMTGGGPSFSTDVITTFIYRNAFGSSVVRIGYASATAVLFGLIVIFAGIIQGIISRQARAKQ